MNQGQNLEMNQHAGLLHQSDNYVVGSVSVNYTPYMYYIYYCKT